MLTDKTLIRQVLLERHGDWTLSAIVTRFGGLGVIVHDEECVVLYQGDNIIHARDWIRERHAGQRAA